MDGRCGDWKDWLLCLAVIVVLEARFPSMAKNPEGHSPKHRRRRKVQVPEPNSTVVSEEPKATKSKAAKTKIDSIFFYGSAIALVQLFLALWQWNGVEMRWLFSIVIYAILILTSLLLLWRWETAQQWSRRSRIIVSLIVVIVLGTVSGMGVLTEYHHERPPDSALVITSELTGLAIAAPFKSDTDFVDLALDVNNNEDSAIQNLTFTVTLVGSYIGDIKEVSKTGCEFHPPEIQKLHAPFLLTSPDGRSKRVDFGEVMARSTPNHPIHSTNGWTVFCPRVFGNSTVKISIAADQSSTLSPDVVKTKGKYDLLPSQQGSKPVNFDVNTKVMK